jgi:Yip1 domain
MSVDAINDTSGVEGAGLSQVERVVDAYIAPSKTFTDILRSSSWWLPFLLVILVSLIATVVVDKRVGFDTVVQNSMHDSPKQEEKLAELQPEQRAAQLRIMAVAYRYSAYASPVFVLLISAIGTLALWASFNFGLGAKTTFGQMFSVWMYASLPKLLSGLLMILTLLFGGAAESFNLKNPVGTNLGFYMSDSAAWVKTLLGFFDVLGIWVLVLMVIGTAIVAKVKRQQAAMVVVGWWLLALIVSVGLTAAFS